MELPIPRQFHCLELQNYPTHLPRPWVASETETANTCSNSALTLNATLHNYPPTTRLDDRRMGIHAHIFQPTQPTVFVDPETARTMSMTAVQCQWHHYPPNMHCVLAATLPSPLVSYHRIWDNFYFSIGHSCSLSAQVSSVNFYQERLPTSRSRSRREWC